MSYHLDKIGFYREADLHVGYRLHAHLCFLSYRKPSIILEEDGRARGAADVLRTPSVRAWQLTRTGRYSRALRSTSVAKAAGRLGQAAKCPRGEVAQEALGLIETQRATDFASYGTAVSRIDAAWPAMKQFAQAVTH